MKRRIFQTCISEKPIAAESHSLEFLKIYLGLERIFLVDI